MLDVVTNRSTHEDFPNTYCKVITQPGAFEWYSKMKHLMPEDPLLWVGFVKKMYQGDLIEITALVRSVALADWHYIEIPQDSTGGALYYMTIEGYTNVEDQVKLVEFITVEQDHIFFSKMDWR